MSTKFSGDGNEIVCATKSAELLCYDLVSNQMISRLKTTHTDDINSVCFVNRQHSNVILTGSDDSLVKIWDRRALNSNRPAGVFVGHAEGIANVCSKGDGIQVASNSKD